MKKLLTTFMATTIMATSIFGFSACTAELSDTDANKLTSLQQQMQELQTNSAETITSLQQQIQLLTNQLKEKSDLETITSLQQQIKDLQEKLNATQTALVSPMANESYDKLKYIDKNLSDRDCLNGENFKQTQEYIKTKLSNAGYTETDIEFQEIPFTKYVKSEKIDESLSAVKSYTTDGKTYSKQGWKYVESENGEYAKATVVSENIIVTKKCKTDKDGNEPKQIIVGMHYDGTGTGDNGSGVALGLSAAEKIQSVETTYTIKFIFFTAEEYGCYGSSFYANNMTDEEVENTLYMINMDSLVCGDYCYLYGGVQDNTEKKVYKTEAYDNAMEMAESLGLNFKSNPWTWDNLSPDDKEYGLPSYASPSTGDWSDHAGFSDKGITYLYMEATNWDIPDYTGYGESKLTGMIMNTENDYLDYIETYYPGRPLAHLTKFATLLNALLLQKDYGV